MSEDELKQLRAETFQLREEVADLSGRYGRLVWAVRKAIEAEHDPQLLHDALVRCDQLILSEWEQFDIWQYAKKE